MLIGTRRSIVSREALASVTGGTLILQPDAATGKDTNVANFASQALANYGVAPYLCYQSSGRALLYFDLSSIPSGATCESATLHIVKGVAAGTNFAATLSVYSIAVGNAGWIEGTKNGGQAGAGEPCWNAKEADGAGGVTTPWAGSAGLSTSGTDYEAVAMGSVAVNRTDAQYTEKQISLNTTRVAGWFGTPNTNYGILCKNTADVWAFCSSDHATAEYRPKLVVVYS